MNIIITLPENLITAIQKGRKKYEMRKTIPVSFNPMKDVIYVAQKGTGYVVGYMITGNILHITDYALLRSRYLKNLAIDEEYLNSYIRYSNKIHLFPIIQFITYKNPLPIKDYFEHSKAPQSFVYTRRNIRQRFREAISLT